MLHKLSFSFVHESVRWLNSRGQVDKSVKILKAIAKTNGKTVGDEVYESFKVRFTHIKQIQKYSEICYKRVI